MAFDEGGSPEGPAQPYQQDFTLNWRDLVSRTFTLWGRKLAQYLAILGPPILILGVIDAVTVWIFPALAGTTSISSASSSPLGLISLLRVYGGDPTLFAISVGVAVILIIVSAITVGACIKFALDNYGALDRGDVGASLSFAVGKAVPLIIVNLILSGLLVILLIPGRLALDPVLATLFTLDPTDVSAILAISGPLWTGLLYLLAGHIIAVCIFARLVVAPVLVVDKDLSAVDAIKKSFSMSSHHFWHILSGFILLFIPVLILDMILTLFSLPLTLVLGGTTLASSISDAVLALVSQILFSPLYYIFGAVLYRDLASRTTVATKEWW